MLLSRSGEEMREFLKGTYKLSELLAVIIAPSPSGPVTLCCFKQNVERER